MHWSSSIQKNKRKKGGFTVIEMIVATAVFVMVITAVSGSFLSIFDAYKKVTASRSNLDNLTAAVESMDRAIKTGLLYHCGSTGTLGVAQECPFSGGGSSYLAIEAEDGNLGSDSDQIVFKLLNGRIWRSSDGGTNFIPITVAPPAVNITTCKFYVTGGKPLLVSDGLAGNIDQPKVTILLRGTVGINPRTSSDFSIQTTVTQRRPDIN